MQPRTLTEIVLRSFERHAREDHFGYKKDGEWRTLSSLEAREKVRRIAGALVREGVRPGDRVAIVSPTRLEWALADYATGLARGVVVPVYPTLTAPQIRDILAHSGASVALVAGRDEWRRLSSILGDLPALRVAVSFDRLSDEGAPPDLEEFAQGPAVEPGEPPAPGDLASVIYTSGTTGPPKGVMLTHANIASNVLACTEACPFGRSDRHLTFLPLSHIFERMVNYYMLWNGVSVWFAEDIGRIKENLLEVRPTILTSVPRILEKVLAGVEEQAEAGGLRGLLVRRAVASARAWTRAAHGPRRDVPVAVTLERLVLDRLVLAKVRARLGGRVHSVITGGAATPAAVTEFFTGAGIRVQPGYGMTETSPVLAFNTPTHYRLATVGKAVPGVELRIAPDGEILARGPNVMRGYLDDEQATRAVLDGDGWLHTGDVGELDADGFLRITDRKKDLIATAGGKKIAPQPIEERLGRGRLIAQAVLVGEGRPYVAALVVPRWTALEEWARTKGLPTTDRRALLGHADVLDLYRREIEACCATLARFEVPKRFTLLERELAEAEGELTPLLKVKRRVVADRYRALIDAMYGGDPGEG